MAEIRALPKPERERLVDELLRMEDPDRGLVLREDCSRAMDGAREEIRRGDREVLRPDQL